MRDDTHHLGTEYSDRVRSLTSCWIQLSLLIILRPNPVSPYYLQVYTSWAAPFFSHFAVADSRL